MSKLDDATAAAIAELHRQAEISGAATEDNGELAQVDGSFSVRRLVWAVAEALKEANSPPDASLTPSEDYWRAQYRKAERALLGARWTEAEALDLVELVKFGSHPPRPAHRGFI